MCHKSLVKYNIKQGERKKIRGKGKDRCDDIAMRKEERETLL